MRGFDPRAMQRMMKQMKMKMDEIDGVEEVVIKTSDKEIRIKNPSVISTTAAGQVTYQVMGGEEITSEKEEENNEDITLIVSQTGVSEAEAKKALMEANGNIAEAILKLQK